ncbi:MAG TPA: hypothetical protein VMR52_02940 [Dehalococcoidia bacterium]|nr:hypothetical protein [Dehalococcoidia bacterium]
MADVAPGVSAEQTSAASFGVALESGHAASLAEFSPQRVWKYCNHEPKFQDAAV